MVFKLQFFSGRRFKTLIGSSLALSLCFVAFLGSNPAISAEPEYTLENARSLYQNGQYFRAARYAFSVATQGAEVPRAHSLVSRSLVRAGLYQSASYFFIRAISTRDPGAIREALLDTDELIVRVGVDFLRPYLFRYTKIEDYNTQNRNAFLYAMAKTTLLKGEYDRALDYARRVESGSENYPFALQIRGTAHAILGQAENALREFKSCEIAAEDRSRKELGVAHEFSDLMNRCVASKARVLYQMGDYKDADRVYDEVAKESFVWPDILFEQAWNAFAAKEINKTLGKLVTYKSPGFSFVFNPEIDVLRAQSYLSLCLYNDANETINDFNRKYLKIGEYVKKFVEIKSNDLESFFEAGKNLSTQNRHPRDDFERVLFRFVRSPYFLSTVRAEAAISRERAAMQAFHHSQFGSAPLSQGFPGFLSQVIEMRKRATRKMGGAFVKNSLIDYHSTLIADFEKMAFIKLEMLSRAKDKILKRTEVQSSSRDRGVNEPRRRDDQYRFGFNGEFWADELGDYVFALESECSK